MKHEAPPKASTKAIPGRPAAPSEPEEVIDTTPEGLPSADETDPLKIKRAVLTEDGWVVPAKAEEIVNTEEPE